MHAKFQQIRELENHVFQLVNIFFSRVVRSVCDQRSLFQHMSSAVVLLLPCSCAISCIMKVLKLLLTSSAYAYIVQVSQQKQSSQEEQARAITLQNTLQTLLTTAEYKTKSTASLLAKQCYQKVL